MACRAVKASVRRSRMSIIGVLVLTTVMVMGAANVAGSTAAPASGVPYICRVTPPNGNPPPGYDPTPYHYGNGKLWTDLWAQGIVLVTPDQVQPDGTLAMKWPWWRAVRGHLTVVGHRLDAPAPPLRVDIPSDNGYGRFQPSTLLFPTEGCWQITGSVGNASLTVVMLVLRSPALVVPATPPTTR